MYIFLKLKEAEKKLKFGIKKLLKYYNTRF